MKTLLLVLSLLFSSAALSAEPERYQVPLYSANGEMSLITLVDSNPKNNPRADICLNTWTEQRQSIQCLFKHKDGKTEWMEVFGVNSSS